MIIPRVSLRPKQNKNRVLLTWIISYVVILIVPLLFSLAGQLYSEYTLVRTLYQLQEESALQMQSLCDKELESIRKMGSQISEDSRVRNWLESEDNSVSYGDARMNLKETFEYLRSIMDNDAQITDIILLDNKQGYIISARSASNAYDSDIFGYMEQFSMARETFWDYVRTEGSPFLFFTDSQGKSDLYYLSVIITNNVRTPDGFLLIRIDLTDLIPTGAENSIPLLILNDSQIYHIPSRTLFEENTISSLFKTTKYGTRLTLNGIRYDGVVRTSSASRGIRYFYGTDSDYVLRASHRSICFYLALVIMSLVIGWFLALHLSRKQYDPLQKLADYMKKQRLTAKMDEKDNIYETIRSEYEDVLTKSRRLASRLDSEQEILISNTLERLLKGRYQTEAAAENDLDDFGITFEKSCFHVLLAAVDDYTALSREEIPAKEQDPFGLIRFLISNIGLENIREVFPDAFAVEVDLFVCFIVNHETASEDEICESLGMAFGKTAALLKEKLNLSVSSYCSNSHDSMLDLNICYSECLSLMESGRTQKEVSASSADSLAENIRTAEEKKYSELLMTEDFTEAMTAFYRLRDAHSENGYVFHLLYITMDALRGSQYEEEMNASVQKMFSGPCSETEICETIRKLFLQFDVARNEKNISSSTAKAEKIRNYIDLNIYDENLSLTAIAQEFGITESYVTKLLRSGYGIHVNTYINGRRVEYIKHLIRTTNLSVQEISVKAGFASYRTMIRVFRQFENMTPTEYRKSL